VHDNVLNDPDQMRYGQEITQVNGKRVPDFLSLDIRADYKVQMRRSDLTLFLDVTNIQNTFNVSREVFIPLTGEVTRTGLGMLPTFGVKLEL
jgi:hypothetical protein